MKYVLDSCVGFKWAFAESDTVKALKLRDDFRSSLVELLAPDVFPVELAHAITRAERSNRITPIEGASSMKAILMLLPELHDSLSLLPRAYELSSLTKPFVS
jgi:hypothetical protein